MFKGRLLLSISVVAVLLMSVFNSASMATNLVINGGFDDGSTNWSYSSPWGGAYFYTDAGDTICSNGGWGDGYGKDWSSANLWQDTGATFQADTEYTMSVVWREAPGEGPIESVKFTIQDVTDSWTVVAKDWYTTTEGTNWVTDTLVFDTATNPSVVGHNIGVGVDLTSSAGTWVHLDSISLVPEPATIALLGLGGLALIRRKR